MNSTIIMLLIKMKTNIKILNMPTVNPKTYTIDYQNQPELVKKNKIQKKTMNLTFKRMNLNPKIQIKNSLSNRILLNQKIINLNRTIR